jgi:hypothetical protein
MSKEKVDAISTLKQKVVVIEEWMEYLVRQGEELRHVIRKCKMRHIIGLISPRDLMVNFGFTKR